MVPAKLQPALLGGLFIGVLSALPFISAANLCCCLWIVSGGGLASYLAQQDHPGPLTPGDGASIGLQAGTIGAIVHLIVSVPLTIFMAPLQRRLLEQFLEQAQNVPPEIRDVIEQFEPAVGGLRLHVRRDAHPRCHLRFAWRVPSPRSCSARLHLPHHQQAIRPPPKPEARSPTCRNYVK